MLMRTDPLRSWDRFTGLFDQMAVPACPMDAYRLGDVVTVEFELPGVDPETIDVQIERGELRLTAHRRRTVPEGAQFLVRERAEATISRRLMLGDVLDLDHVDAEYRDGILTLRIPLSDTAKPRRVEVRRTVGEGQAARPIEVGTA